MITKEEKFKKLKLELAKIHDELKNNYQISNEYKKLMIYRETEILSPNKNKKGVLCHVKRNKGNGVLYIYIPNNTNIKEDDICVLNLTKY